MNSFFELVITKTTLGYSIYDRNTLNRIDLFPNTPEGKERLLEFINKTLEKANVSDIKNVV